MNASFDPQFESESQTVDAAAYAGNALNGFSTAPRGAVVNRTHRVVRERAVVMQARRSYVRSLLVPLAICSVLLILVCAGVWTGMYEYQAAEAAQADVAAPADANNHLLVMLLWFAPVILALVGTALFRLVRNGSDPRTVR